MPSAGRAGQGGHRNGSYLTAPKVRPRTSWRWLNQPNTRMGATAMVDAADSLAKNRPSGLEKEAMNAVSGAACEAREVQAPERLVPAQDQGQQAGGGDAGQGEGQQQVPQLRPGAGAVHAAGLEDLVRHFLVEGEQHPDDDRQVHQRVHADHADPGNPAARPCGTAGRSAPARRPAAASWWTASTAACRGSAPWDGTPSHRRRGWRTTAPARCRRPRSPTLFAAWRR